MKMSLPTKALQNLDLQMIVLEAIRLGIFTEEDVKNLIREIAEAQS